MPARHLQHRLELGILGLTQSRRAAEIPLRQAEQGTQSAVLRQEIARQIDGIAARNAGAQKNRQQFGIGQGARPVGQQFFARTFGVGPVGDSHRHPFEAAGM